MSKASKPTKVFGVDLVFFFGIYALAVFLVVGLPIFVYWVVR